MRLLLGGPRSFCLGVSRAVTIVEELLDLYDEPPFASAWLLEVARRRKHGRAVVVIGHPHHAEINGILGDYEVFDLRRHFRRGERNPRLFDATWPLVTKMLKGDPPALLSGSLKETTA